MTKRGHCPYNSIVHGSSVEMIRNLTNEFTSPLFHVLNNTKFQSVSSGFEDNQAVASHIWDSLAKDQLINTLEEAESEQEQLPKL